MRCLETLFKQSLSPSRFEVIVVVDGSTDDTAEALKHVGPTCGFQVIEQENRGLAGARNSGYKVARAELVLFLDDDMLCDSGLVEAHLKAHAGTDPIAAFGAIFLSPDSPPSLAAKCFKREIGSSHLKRRSNAKLNWELRECVFSNSSLLRSKLDALGGFDESFRMREDLEFGIRLFQTCVSPMPIPEAIAYQYYDKSSEDLIRDAKAFAMADFLLARKHPDTKLTGQIAPLNGGSGWKHTARNIAARNPQIADLVLRPICNLADKLYPIRTLRSLGVRTLQARRRIHWIHRFRELQSTVSDPAPSLTR
jgi:GT2 family glycosyltransferase